MRLRFSIFNFITDLIASSAAEAKSISVLFSINLKYFLMIERLLSNNTGQSTLAIRDGLCTPTFAPVGNDHYCGQTFRPGQDRRTGANLCANKKPDIDIRRMKGWLSIQHGNDGVIPPRQEDFVVAASGRNSGRFGGLGGSNKGLLVILAEPISAFPADDLESLCGKVCNNSGMFFFCGHDFSPLRLPHTQYVAAEKIIQTNIYTYGIFRHLDLVGIANHVEGLKQNNRNIKFLGLTEKCGQSFNGSFLGFVCQSHGVVLSLLAVQIADNVKKCYVMFAGTFCLSQIRVISAFV